MKPSDATEFTGQCLCGAIRFHGTYAEERSLRACHCGQCRRWSGHYWASVSASELTVEGEPKWFRSSDFAQRGFCPECGSSLFWKRDGAARPEIATGAIDNPTHLRLEGHIFVADKGDYYEITDGLPQDQGG